MAIYSVTIVADTLEAAAALRRMGLDLHERAARRRPQTGEITVPAILSDEAIQNVRAAGYRVDITEDLEQVAAARAVEVNMRANRFVHAPREAQATREPAGETATQRTLERLMDLSDLEETRARAAARTALGGYLTPDEVESVAPDACGSLSEPGLCGACAGENVGRTECPRPQIARWKPGEPGRRPHHWQYACARVGWIGHLRGVRHQSPQVSTRPGRR